MPQRLFLIIIFGMAVGVLASHARAQDAPRRPGSELLPPPVHVAPDDGGTTENLAVPPVLAANSTSQLPDYHMAVTLNTSIGVAHVTETVKWTNRFSKPTDELVFHVYPNHRPDKKLLATYRRTLESFRVDPAEGIDPVGRRVSFHKIEADGEDLSFAFDEDCDTLFHVHLPAPVQPGESVTVTLEFSLDIPPMQGRFGQFGGVTSLLNWYPILAVYSDKGWDDAPYLAWHQPWHNEAGNYVVDLRLPDGEIVASSGVTAEQTAADEDGYQHLQLVGKGIRDFAIVASPRYQVLEGEVNGIRVQVMAFPEHQRYAEISLQTALESLALYTDWFGPYPHKEFKIAESFFGWNGNETSGMILIDKRVFEAPHAAHRYIEHLVSHETCHQWWYATVGTDGFRQTWMDEGLVTYFTEWRFEQKYGHDAPVFSWPEKLSWLPNIRYQTLVHNGYYLYRGRGGHGVTLAPLPEIGHVHNTFFLVYDRGSKVTSMIHQRLGNEDFFRFLRTVYRKYQFKILYVEDFRRELEAFTGHSWKQFFDDWLRTNKITDWRVDDVRVQPGEDGYTTTVTVEQAGEIEEPVDVAIRPLHPDLPELRVSVDPHVGDSYVYDGAAVNRLNDRFWEIQLQTSAPPAQVEVDPDRWVQDASWGDNRWKSEPEIRFTPFYNPLYEVPIVHPMDRLSIVYGPGVDIYGRLVARGSIVSLHNFRISPFVAYKPEQNDNMLSAGVDAIVYNFPWPNVSLGVEYQHSLSSDVFNDPVDQGKVFLRWDKIYTTSFIYPNLSFVEAYFRFGDNFFPDYDIRPPTTPGVEDYRDIRAVGLSYHLDSRMPYWNPDSGFAFDIAYEYGFRAFGEGETFHRVWSQLSGVRRLPDHLGWLSRTKLAGRVAGGIGSPDNGEHFRFGGPQRFRGQRSEDTEGSKFWLASGEWRFPLLDDLGICLVDNVANLRSIYGSLFYDVGESYIQGNSQGVDHAVGAGLYFDLPLFSFVENFTLRTEFAHSLENDTEVLWLGWYHTF